MTMSWEELKNTLAIAFHTANELEVRFKDKKVEPRFITLKITDHALWPYDVDIETREEALVRQMAERERLRHRMVVFSGGEWQSKNQLEYISLLGDIDLATVSAIVKRDRCYPRN